MLGVMNIIQNQIKQRLAEPEGIGYVRSFLESQAIARRTELATRVCERFGFYDRPGRAQVAGCLKALREFERGGQVSLPAACTPSRRPPAPRRLSESVPQPRRCLRRPERYGVWS